MEQVEETSDANPSRRGTRVVPRISWTIWIVDGVLFFALILGAWYAWPIQLEAGRLHAKRLELQRKVGEMPIQDSSKYHVMLLRSENPLEFRWRVYVPTKTAAMLSSESRSSDGSSSSTSGLLTSSDSAQEGLISVWILPSENGSRAEIKIRTLSANSHGSITMHVRDESIQQTMNAKNTSPWKIAGRNGLETFNTGELISLLEIESPHTDGTSKKNGVVSIRLGIQEAFDKARKK